jgi:sporulation protein YlmC with PRC-barrel domain
MSTNVVRLSHLLELDVEDERGRSLGRVHDVRVRRSADRAAGYRVEGLIIRGRGVLVRLGWRRARNPAPLSPDDLLPWDHVVAIEADRLVVRLSSPGS